VLAAGVDEDDDEELDSLDDVDELSEDEALSLFVPDEVDPML
jgi:hypothetical protein